jgi:hypothetical protein
VDVTIRGAVVLDVVHSTDGQTYLRVETPAEDVLLIGSGDQGVTLAGAR